jgi:hypothetical protein
LLNNLLKLFLVSKYRNDPNDRGIKYKQKAQHLFSHLQFSLTSCQRCSPAKVAVDSPCFNEQSSPATRTLSPKEHLRGREVATLGHMFPKNTIQWWGRSQMFGQLFAAYTFARVSALKCYYESADKSVCIVHENQTPSVFAL